jgi:hypothetical protein
MKGHMIFENNLRHWAHKIMQIILGHMYEDYDLKDVKLKPMKKLSLMFHVSCFVFQISSFFFCVLRFLFQFHVSCFSSCYMFHFHFRMKKIHKHETQQWWELGAILFIAPPCSSLHKHNNKGSMTNAQEGVKE